MAVEAYIDYDKTMQMIDEITEKQTRINTIIDEELLVNRVNEVRENYNGEAALAFETALKTTAKKVQEDLNKLVDDLKTEAKRQKEAFEAQDSALAG